MECGFPIRYTPISQKKVEIPLIDMYRFADIATLFDGWSKKA